MGVAARDLAIWARLADCPDAIKTSSLVVRNGWWWSMPGLWLGRAGRRCAEPVGATEGLALRWPSTVTDAALPERARMARRVVELAHGHG